MRRKNMLALGMSLVFCATATAVPLYANPLDRQERTVSEEKETSENQAENSVVDIAENKNVDSEEGSKESLANFPEETKNSDSEEAVEAVEETENAEVSSEETESIEENSMVKPLSLGYSGFRMANTKSYTLDDKILVMNLEFGGVEFAARDHMEVLRNQPVKVSGLTINKNNHSVDDPEEKICKVLPNRIVEKKVGGDWTRYKLDFFTPGEYRYIYTLAMGKNSPYYFLPQETPDNDEHFTYTTVVIGDRFKDNQSNSSILVKYSKSTSASGKDPNYKYYSLETDSFFVKEAKKISKVYLNSSSSIPFSPTSIPLNFSFSRASVSFVESPSNRKFSFSTASCEIPFSSISLITPSFPILSSLSKATVKSINCSDISAYSARPERIFRLLMQIFTGIPSSAKLFKYNCTSSTSCHKLSEPTTSASHW